MEVIVTGVERLEKGWKGIGYIQREGFRLDVVLPLKDDQEWGQVMNDLGNGKSHKLNRQIDWLGMISVHLKQKS